MSSRSLRSSRVLLSVIPYWRICSCARKSFYFRSGIKHDGMAAADPADIRYGVGRDFSLATGYVVVAPF